VVVSPNVTISALRNIGVSHAKGEVVVFIDADVYLEDDWGANAKSAIEVVRQNPMIITGSTYGLAPEAGWLERSWFGPLIERRERGYLNGGHLIVNKELFQSVGGFSENLETGEDYDFCQKAKKAGAKIIHDSDLRVVHLGYPKTVKAFFKRERWHGRGDCGSVAAVLGSKVALVSLAQFGLFLIAIAWALSLGSCGPLVAYLFVLVGIGAAAGFARCGEVNPNFLPCTFLYILYFQARALSFFDVMRMKLVGR
jgi:glycosyltransferase involved in cell wall biosynthesis